MIPKGWHQILTEVYGNYMEMPPRTNGCPPTPASKSVFLIRACRRGGQTRTGGMRTERLAAYANMPQERITDKKRWTGCYQLWYRSTTKKRHWKNFTGKPHGMLEQISWDYELLLSMTAAGMDQDILDRLAASDSRVRVISFSRNFGHEAAMIAGLTTAGETASSGRTRTCSIPPECIPDIWHKFEEGYQVINMVRTKNRTAGLVKNITSSGFYWLDQPISDVHFESNASDFFLQSAPCGLGAEEQLQGEGAFPQRLCAERGFKKPPLSMKQGARVAGESKYSIKKLFVFSINTIPVLFSNMPLKLGIYEHIPGALLGLAVMIYTLCTRKGAPSGYYATIVVLICFMAFAMMFVIIGIIGEYIAILFTELKDRPVYIVDRTENMD